MGERSYYDLHKRLIAFSVLVCRIVESLPSNRVGRHVAGQLLRCGTAPAPNHGEAQSAESRRDFIHKMGVCLKELRESKRALRLAHRAKLVKPASKIEPLLAETEELIRIFFTGIRTARGRLQGNAKD